jgi:hypothetical protein
MIMRRAVWKAMVEGIFALIFIWIFFGCATQPRQSAPKLPPAPAPGTKPEPGISSKTSVLKTPVPSGQRPEFYVHKVRWPGETISVIAQWYTGTQNNWEYIVKVNSGFDPKRMEIGDEILIPVALLKKREPMPRKYLGTSVRKKDPPSVPQVTPPIKSVKEKITVAPEKEHQVSELEEIELFQPKDTEQSARKLEEIELFQPKDTEQTTEVPGEIDLFKPIE